MKKRNFLTTATLAALVAAQMAMPVMAAPATNVATDDQHTTIGISELKKKSAAQASFDVPLYLVVAAVEKQAAIEKPTNYKIENKTEGYAVGVTKMQIENLAEYKENDLDNSGWVIVDNNNGNPTLDNKRKISLQLGSLWMPSTEGKAVNEKVNVPIEANSFFREADNGGKAVYKKIVKDNPLQIAVNGTVAAVERADKSASSQFKVTYTVSPLLDDGTVLSAVYVGDKKDEAGLN